MKRQIPIYCLLVIMLFTVHVISAQQVQNNKTFVRYGLNDEQVSLQATEALTKQFSSTTTVQFTAEGRVEEAQYGLSHERFSATFKGLPIEYGQYIVHKKEGQIYGVSGISFDETSLNAQPSIKAERGLQTILSHVNAEQYLWEIDDPSVYFEGYEKPKGELVVLPSIEGVSKKAQLTYKYFVFSLQPMSAAYYYVDAHNGEIVFENSIICHADVAGNGNAYFNGAVNFRAESIGGVNRLFNTTITSGGIHTVKAINGPTQTMDITSVTPTFSDDIGVQAHWAAEKTLNYFSNVHGRSSYDGSGSKITLVTNIPNYNNAYWTGTTAVFGNGDGTSYDNFASLDIVGHEITHGVVGNSAGLIYSYEPGALNESFADIFGECIEAYTTGSNDWLLGEETKIGTGQAFRSMSNPNTFSHPDTYRGSHWVTGSFDNGGVHFNSSVQNHWFYLLVNGGSGSNDWNQTYNVVGIGKTKAEAIAYRNLTVYLTPSSQYTDARAGAIQSAIDLYGPGSAEEMAVTNAWYAVGVGTFYNNPNALDCTSRNLTLTITFDDRPDLIAWNVSDNMTTGFEFAKFLNSYNVSQANTTVIENLTFTKSGTFRLNFYDLETDGLCCTGGTGSFALMDGNTTVVSGSIFDLSETFQFCVDIEAGPDQETNRPTVPQDVTVTNITANAATVDWTSSTDDTGVYGYFVFVNGVWQVEPTNTVTLSGLVANTQYTINVFAQDVLTNFSTKGQTVTFTTTNVIDNTPPTIPTNLSSNNIASNNYDLSWNASTDNIGVDHYDVYLNGQYYSSTTQLNENISGLSANTAYDNYIIAVDAAGNQSASSTILTTTTTNAGPVCASGALTLSITFDNNPEQVAWELKDKNNQWYAYSNQNDYAGQLPGTTLVIQLPALVAGDYAFVMYDASGDGICCVNGSGSYEISDGNNILVSGSTYDFSKVTQFCVSQTNGDVIDQIPPSDFILTASNPSTTTVDLSWTPSVDNEALFGYAFFLDGNYLGYVDYTYSALTLPGLNPNTTYNLNMVSRDFIGNFSNLSNTVTFTTTSGVTSIVVHQGYFETGWDGWIDGGNDCRRMTTQYAAEGVKAVRIRDNSGAASSMTSQTFDLSSYDSVRVDFEYYARSMESNEDFWLRFEENGNWTTVKAYVKNIDFFGNGFYSGSVLLTAQQYNFATNSKFRFQCDASGNGDKIFIDAVEITAYGTSNNFAPEPMSEEIINPFLLFADKAQSHSADLTVVGKEKKIEMTLVPNPVQDYLQVNYADQDEIANVIIYELNGQRVIESDDAERINVSKLSTGLYYVHIELADGTSQILKFVKINE